MSKPGPKKKNNAMRIFEGNPSHRPLNEFEPTPDVVQELPPCPDWLDEDATEFYEQTGRILLDMEVLTVADIPGLIVVAESWGEFLLTAKMMKQDPSARVTTTDKGYTQVSAWLTVKNAAKKQIKEWFAQYGLTPSGRAGMIAGGKKNADPMAELKDVMQKKGTG